MRKLPEEPADGTRPFPAPSSREVPTRKSEITESQIVATLHETDVGVPVKDTGRTHRPSPSTCAEGRA